MRLVNGLHLWLFYDFSLRFFCSCLASMLVTLFFIGILLVTACPLVISVWIAVHYVCKAPWSMYKIIWKCTEVLILFGMRKISRHIRESSLMMILQRFLDLSTSLVSGLRTHKYLVCIRRRWIMQHTFLISSVSQIILLLLLLLFLWNGSISSACKNLRYTSFRIFSTRFSACWNHRVIL